MLRSARPSATSAAPRHPFRPGPPTDPAVTAARAIVDDLAAISRAIGELLLEVAPAYLSDTDTDTDTDAADALAVLCDEIRESPDQGLAARRYALTGDRRALRGTIL
ncbi:hypothetical protein ACFTWS_39780 [Streptomyces sp. NPDC057027]|uniref:hypothetical protein n=1 Tax=Streptomyces sp. NPDC057027 TaxID=3346004 RepID=UPI00362BC767